MVTTSTIAAIDSKAPSLFDFAQKKKPVAVVFSPEQRTLQTTSPTLAKFLNCKLIDDPVITGNDVNKVVNDSITLVLSNKLIFLTGTVGTVALMYYLSYQFYVNDLAKKKA